MSRPPKATVEYFPHFVNHGKTIFILENKYGNDGYAFWFKLLEILGATENHYIDCEIVESWEFLITKTHLNEAVTIEILNLLSRMDAIDKKLWGYKIIRSNNYVKNLSIVYLKRKTQAISNQEVLRLCLQQRKINTAICGAETTSTDSFRHENYDNMTINHDCRTGNIDGGTGNPQSKVKDSKGENSKVENSKERDMLSSEQKTAHTTIGFDMPPHNVVESLGDVECPIGENGKDAVGNTSLVTGSSDVDVPRSGIRSRTDVSSGGEFHVGDNGAGGNGRIAKEDIPAITDSLGDSEYSHGDNGTTQPAGDVQRVKYMGSVIEIMDYFNQVAGTAYKHNSKETVKLIVSRLKSGFTIEDFKKVIDKKAAQWKGDPKMSAYLRPITLFSTKFESYLNEQSGGFYGKKAFEHVGIDEKDYSGFESW